MQRCILAVVLALAVMLAGAAVLVALRERTAVERTETSRAGSEPVEHHDESALASPRDPDRITAADVATDASALSGFPIASWTGVRVRATALEDERPLANVRILATTPGSDPAWVDVVHRHGKRGESPLTDADGIAELELAAGIGYLIEAHAPRGVEGMRTVRLDSPLVEGEVREIAIALPTKPDLVFHGRVVDRETSAPIAGARITPTAGMTDVDAWTADADGRFVARVKSWHRPLLTVTAVGYELAQVVPDASYETRERALEIAIARTASARITVLDATGAPLADVEVLLETEKYRFGRPDDRALIAWGHTGRETYRATTNATGVAVFEELPPRMPLAGSLPRKGREPFRAPEDLTLAPGELRTLTWRIGGGCTIRGVALEQSGAPAKGLAVCLEPAPIAISVYLDASARPGRRLASTDAEGRFAFTDVGPGDWWLSPAPTRFTSRRRLQPLDAAPRARVVTVAPDADEVDVEIRVHRGLSISGRVLDPNGAPVPSAQIEYTRASETLHGFEIIHDDQGRFVLGPIEAGEHELRATLVHGFVASEPVVARAGDTNVVLRVRAGGTLEGLVVDGSTGMPSAARLVVSAGELEDDSTSIARVDASGKFRVEGLAPGTYDVAASTPGGLVALVRGLQVDAKSTQGMRVALVPGARVRVRFDGPWAGTMAVVVADGTLVSGDGLEKGTEATLAAPSGAIVVRVRDVAGSRHFDLAVTLKVGETRDLVFDGAWK